MIPEQKTKAERYCEAWAGSLALLLSRMTSSDWSAKAGAAEQYVPIAHLRTRATTGLPGQQWFALSAADAGKLLHLFLGEEVSLSSQLDEMHREALEELLRQWCGLAASALKAEFGELSFEVTLDAGPGEHSGPNTFFLASDGTQPLTVSMALAAELENFLREPEKAAHAEPARPVSDGGVQELLRQGNLDLLMDVELPVMLRFGSRQATLREVLDLATGAVLELDREVQEPVDLVLNGKLIARGDVVVVDGNYGLRITEVASAQQRVSSL